MKLCAVVVFFNPSKISNLKDNLLSYSAKLERVYIVDNSDSDNGSLVQDIKNCVYIPNGKNIGIAGALNIGCERALKDGFDFAMTMDQDSFFEDRDFDNYLSFFKSYSENQEIQSFAPRLKMLKNNIAISKKIRQNVLSPLKKKLLGRHYKLTVTSLEDIEYPKLVITSGNIINLEIWEKVGKFDETLFIDEVDTDFCRRLELFGYKIIRFNTVMLNHKIGEIRVTLFPKKTYHNNFRFYYIIRNGFIQKKRYGNLLKDSLAYEKVLLWRYFKDYCILDFHAFHHLIIFIKAYLNAKSYSKNDTFLQKVLENKIN